MNCGSDRTFREEECVISHSGLQQPRQVPPVAGPQPVVTGARLVTAELSVLHPTLQTHRCSSTHTHTHTPS